MRGSKGTAKLQIEFIKVVLIPYLVKHTLLHMGGPYFLVSACACRRPLKTFCLDARSLLD